MPRENDTKSEDTTPEKPARTRRGKQESQATKKGKSPAFQLYPKDFLTDDKVLCMSPEVRGLYTVLLCIDWLNDGFDSSAMLKLSGFEWLRYDGTLRDDSKAIEAQLLKCFAPHPSKKGFVTNPRLQKERLGQIERQNERSASGKKGAAKKWGNSHALANGSANGSAIQEPIANDSSSSPSSSSSSSPSPKNDHSNDHSKRKRRSRSALPTVDPDEIGDPPTLEHPELPPKLQAFFRAQGLIEAHPNVWVKPGYLEKIREIHTFRPFLDDALQRMYEWSVSHDINPRTKTPGWASYRLKRDHGKTLINQLSTIRDRYRNGKESST